MLMFTEASSIQRSPAAIQTEEELGIAIRAQLARIAPPRKYGLRRPSLVHVWSL
jgi:hypothetical protein